MWAMRPRWTPLMSSGRALLRTARHGSLCPHARWTHVDVVSCGLNAVLCMSSDRGYRVAINELGRVGKRGLCCNDVELWPKTSTYLVSRR